MSNLATWMSNLTAKVSNLGTFLSNLTAKVSNFTVKVSDSQIPDEFIKKRQRPEMPIMTDKSIVVINDDFFRTTLSR
jgi:hypothetical protein